MFVLVCSLFTATAVHGRASVRRSELPAFFTQDATGTLRFEDARVAVRFLPGKVIYRFAGGGGRELHVTYTGGRSSVPVGESELSGRLNYFAGQDSSAWRSDAPTYSEVAYHEMWPGIDVVFAFSAGHLKSEFRIAPGADPTRVRWHVDGADSLVIQSRALVLKMGDNSVREAAPEVFEQDRKAGALRSVRGGFLLLSPSSIGIEVAAYDHRNRLIFDPVIGYSTYLGGSGQSQATAIAVDSQGNSIIAGYTTSLDLAPGATTIGTPLRTTAFVAKLTASGNQLMFCTYLGGSLDNRAFALAVDRWDNIYIAGTTSSSNFPVLKAVQTARHGPQDAFIAELTPAGNALAFSTYWGGSNVEQANAIAIDRQGNIYVAGDTQSSDYPVVHPFQGASGGGFDSFVVKLGISGSKVLWSSYLGGGADDHATGIAVDFTSAVVVGGSTASTNFPTVNAFQPQNAGSQNGFVARINPAGTGLVFSTYVGGSGAAVGLPETVAGVAVDNTASIYVAGTTASTDFHATPGAFQTASAGGFLDAFAIKLNPWGALIYSTYLGGVNVDYGCAIAVDAAGNAHVAGYTTSLDFPSLRSVQNGIKGSYDLFVTKLNTAGTGLVYSTVLGGTQSDSAAAIALDRYGAVLIAGQTASTDFPTTSAYQTTLVGAESAVMARMPIGWKPALFSAAGTWSIDYLSNGGSSGVGPAVQTITTFGNPGDIPIVGDWSGTGHQNLGVFRSGTWFLDLDGDGLFTARDRLFNFGQAGDIPVVGDWDGSGTVKAGLFRNGTFLLDFSGLISGIPTGKSTVTFPFGIAGDVPVVGDWNSLGSSKVGVFRGGQWLLDTNGSHTINGPTHWFGLAGDKPLTGDWDGSGLTKAGLYRNGLFLMDYNGNWNQDAYGDVTLAFGPPEQYALTQY